MALAKKFITLQDAITDLQEALDSLSDNLAELDGAEGKDEKEEARDNLDQGLNDAFFPASQFLNIVKKLSGLADSADAQSDDDE